MARVLSNLDEHLLDESGGVMSGGAIRLGKHSRQTGVVKSWAPKLFSYPVQSGSCSSGTCALHTADRLSF